MSNLSHSPTYFTHPLVLWTALRDRRVRRASARRESRRTPWDASAWQRWADRPPSHPLVAGGGPGSSFAVTPRPGR